MYKTCDTQALTGVPVILVQIFGLGGSITNSLINSPPRLGV